MTSIGLRPALLFSSLTGVKTAASISARKLSNGTTRAIISSGSPFAVIAASLRSASKNPNCPIVPTPANLVSQIRFAQIRKSRYFSRCPQERKVRRWPQLVTQRRTFNYVAQRYLPLHTRKRKGIVRIIESPCQPQRVRLPDRRALRPVGHVAAINGRIVVVAQIGPS